MADSEYPDDVQFAGLVQAATAAAVAQTTRPPTLGKRKRDAPFADDDLPSEESVMDEAPDPTALDYGQTQAASAAPAPHLQSSASVLFREPSTKSAKYSRPPLGKVFASLELAPENFLRLQTAAKAFMLDDAHPDRRDVVGQKKSVGGADVAKLNLWKCVEEFLASHGYGEKYFAPGVGADIPGAPQRTLSWPQDRQSIIRLMMPLMRKMVTNERQRIYAAATRKSGSKSDLAPSHARLSSDGDDGANGTDLSVTSPPTNREPAADAFPRALIEPPVPAQPDGSALATKEPSPSLIFKQSLVLHVNVVSTTDGVSRRVAPRFQLSLEAAPTLPLLMAEVGQRYPLSKDKSSSATGSATVKVWLPDGLVTVAEDGEWMVALLSTGAVDWMDGEVRVLVEV